MTKTNLKNIEDDKKYAKGTTKTQECQQGMMKLQQTIART
jgi:hypothetical protein